MKRGVLLVFLLSVFLSSSLAAAWGPVTHYYIGEKLFEESDTEIIKDCENYKAEFLAGIEAPDLTVAYYYASGGEVYKLTHNWNFQEEVLANAQTQGERCFAYGIATHLIQDGVAHNFFVPKKIEELKLPNWLIHPISEQAIDTILSNQYPDMALRSRGMMDVLFDGQHEHYFVIVQDALGENVQLDAKQELARLRVAVGGGRLYEDLYTVKGAELFDVYSEFAVVLQAISPLIGIDDLGEASFYMNKVYQDTDYTFRNWGLRYAQEPHGFTALGKADESIMASSVLFVVFMLGSMLAIAFAGFKYMRRLPVLLRVSAIGVSIFAFVLSLLLLFLTLAG